MQNLHRHIRIYRLVVQNHLRCLFFVPNVDARKFLSMTMVLVNVKAADLWLILRLSDID